ncbi:hypothetical protein BBJ28_00025508, partial [Nothophytophthora sp. Chile5]
MLFHRLFDCTGLVNSGWQRQRLTGGQRFIQTRAAPLHRLSFCSALSARQQPASTLDKQSLQAIQIQYYLGPMGVNANDVVAAAPASSPSTDGAVKYRLVEAEEVSNKAQMPSQQQQPRGAKPKRKGKLNWSQFPLEGEEEEELQAMAKSSSTAPVAETAPASNNGDSRSRGHFQSRGRGGRGPRGGRFGGHRPQYDNNGTYYNGVYVPNPDIQVSAQWAKNQ